VLGARLEAVASQEEGPRAYFEGRAEKVTRECNMGNIAKC